MPDYYKDKVAIYMTTDAYRKFCAVCDEKQFRKLSVSNIRYNYKFRRIANQGFYFMIEVLPQYLTQIQNIIKSHHKIYTGIYDKDENIHTHTHHVLNPAITYCDGCNLTCAQIYSKQGDIYIPLHVPQRGNINYFTEEKFTTAEEALQASIALAQKCKMKNAKTK